MSATDSRALITDDYVLPDDLEIIFTPGSTTTSKSLTIVSDNVLEHWEDFTVSVTVADVSSGTGVLNSPSTATVIIRDRKIKRKLGGLMLKNWVLFFIKLREREIQFD